LVVINDLRGNMVVNAGRMMRRGSKGMERARRTSTSPGSDWRGQLRQKTTEAARIEAFSIGVGDGIGETVVDWKSSGSIPWRGTTRTMRRIFRWSQIEEGWPVEAAPWRGVGRRCGVVSVREEKRHGG
jgi:hypothetical protein